MAYASAFHQWAVLGQPGRADDGEVEDYRIVVFAGRSSTSQLIPDPEFLGETMMYVVGSPAADRIQITPVADGLRATINGVNGATLKPTSRVAVFSFGGNDNLRMDGVTLRASSMPVRAMILFVAATVMMCSTVAVEMI